MKFLGLANLGFGLFGDDPAIVHIRIIANTALFLLLLFEEGVQKLFYQAVKSGR